MMKIFRNIRQQLAAENKVMAYLRYAIGEIILVVIGILIALQINNWNEYRKDRILEKEYLSRLRKDIKSNITWININILNRYDRKIKCLTEAKAYYQGNYTIKDTLQFLNDVSYGGVYGNADWNLNKNTYNELINTGNLGKIESDTLRTMINNYYEGIRSVSESSKNYISGYINYINSTRAFNNDNPDYFSDFDQKFLLRHLRTEEFYRLANLEMTLGYRVHSWALLTFNAAKKLLKNVDHELEE